tara:strand:- start:20615 stop:21043 length:429 start_codon:yes stop_codon:yes gene_type:complete
MIRYALICDHDHEFDGWFSSSAGFDEQAEAGEIICPQCGSAKVTKALMAPSVSGTKKSKPRPAASSVDPQQMMTMMSALKKHVEENCDYVGDKFADVARAIHYEEEAPRGIYGETTLDEARALIEEGVEVAPLPMPNPKRAN